MQSESDPQSAPRAATRRRIESVIAHSATLPHGRRARYATGCKCDECRRANNEYEKRRNKKRHQGDWNGRVDAGKARAHLAWLSANGVGRHSVSAATNVPDSILYGIITGARTRVAARNERKILAVDLSVRADKVLISSRETWKLIDELLNGGYTKRQLAKWLGYKSPALQWKRGKPITVRNAGRMERLYKLIDAGKMRRAS